MGTYDTTFIGLKTPPTGSGSQDWGDGEAYDVNANQTHLDALLTNEGRIFWVGDNLDVDTYPYFDDGDTPRVFDAIQDAIDAAQTAFAGSTGGCTIYVMPGNYDEHLEFDLRCSISLVGLGTPSQRHAARSGSQALIRGPVDGAVDAPTIKCNPNSTYGTAEISFTNLAFDNQSFNSTGTGTKGARIFEHYPGASWSGTNGYFRFKNCHFKVGEVNTSVTWTYGFRYDKTLIANKWGGLFFDGCLFRFDTSTSQVTSGFYMKTNASESSLYNKLGYRNCAFLIGVQDAYTWDVYGDYINAYIEHCTLSEGVTSGTVATIDGAVNGDVLGVLGGSDATYGNNVQSQLMDFWC